MSDLTGQTKSAPICKGRLVTAEPESQLPKMFAESNASRESLEAKYGQVWSPAEVERDFNVLGFAAAFLLVSRKSDGTKGSLSYQDEQRFYFDWSARDS